MDGRNPELIEHSISEMLCQRVYGLALGYEDLNDYEQLRRDPVFGILAGREELEKPLAGKRGSVAFRNGAISYNNQSWRSACRLPEIIRRSFSTLPQKHGSIKDVQALMRHYAATTMGIYQQENPKSARAIAENVGG